MKIYNNFNWYNSLPQSFHRRSDANRIKAIQSELNQGH